MLRISLIPLREGEYLIDKGKLLNEEIESTVRITKDDAKIVYHPLKSSFRIQVDSIRFHEGSGTPYIEGKMEGILYNIENSEDSIVIKVLYSEYTNLEPNNDIEAIFRLNGSSIS